MVSTQIVLPLIGDPIKLVYQDCFNDFDVAFAFETKMKKWSKAKKKALIESRFVDLIPLSKKKFN